MAFKQQKSTNVTPPHEAKPPPASDMRGDYRGISPTKRFKNEMLSTDCFEHHLKNGVQPKDAQEGKAKDPVPCNE